MKRLPAQRYRVVEIEGMKIDIRISSKAEDGPFFAYVNSEHYKGPDAEKLIEEISRNINAACSLDYRPIIVITEERGVKDIFSIEIRRYFTADHPHLGPQFFTFEHPENTFIYDEDTDGKPGCKTPMYGCLRYSRRKIIPYTPSKWIALMTLKKRCREITARVEDLLTGDHAETIIESLSINLLEAPKTEEDINDHRHPPPQVHPQDAAPPS
jgi:hypothetical protein